MYDGKLPLTLTAYADADFANNPDDRKSVDAVLTMLCGGPITWRSKSLSSTEAEYHALTKAARNIRWLRQLMHEPKQNPTVIYEDNTQAIGLAKNSEDYAQQAARCQVALHPWYDRAR